jgi:hypothetical protein
MFKMTISLSDNPLNCSAPISIDGRTNENTSEDTDGNRDRYNDEGSSREKDDPELVHGWVLWAVWFILGLIMVLSNRYMKVFWKAHMWIHRVSGLLMLILTIVFASIIIKDKGGEIEDNPHSIIGIVILAVVIFTALFGLFTRNKMDSMRWNTIWIIRFKNLHKVKINLF